MNEEIEMIDKALDIVTKLDASDPAHKSLILDARVALMLLKERIVKEEGQ